MTQQESQQNLYAFAELEFMLSSYFQKNVRGMVDSCYKSLKDKQSEEYYRALDSRPVAPGQSGISNASVAAQKVLRDGQWCTKHTEDLMNAVHAQLYMDKSATQHDIGMLVLEWRKLAVTRLGNAGYDRLSKAVGADLAAYYVSHRLDALTLQRIAGLGAPKSTLSYVLTTGMKESFAGVIAGMPDDTASPLDQRVARLQEECFGDGATFAGRALGFGLDMLTPGGMVKGLGLLADIGIRGFAYSQSDGRWKDYDSFERDLGKSLFGSEDAMPSLRDSRLGVNQGSDGVQVLNAEMKKKVFAVSVDMDKVKAIYKRFEKSVNGDAEKMVNMVRDSLVGHHLTVSDSSHLSDAILQKDIPWLIANSSYYTVMALEMKGKGLSSMMIGGRMWGVDEVAQRGYDYARVAYEKQLSQVRQAVREADAAASRQTQPVLSDQAQAGQARYVRTAHGSLQIGHSSGTVPQQRQEALSQPACQDFVSDRPKGDPGQLGGWGDFFDAFGFGGFGLVGKNLGYVLSMLPDMLIGMFTGKSRHLKFSDNLLPIGAIIAGMFVKKNPLLKMLLIGLGGANILNKAGQEILENRDGVRPRPVRQYRHYVEEPLDGRIKDVAMKGNTLLATVDGVPSIITIDEHTVEAYYQGAIPLNTLANAVLRQYDIRKVSVQDSYDRQVNVDEAMERSHGLK